MRWFPPGPKEGVGVSNDATAIFGPPSFKDARFDLAGARSIRIQVRY